MKVVQWINPIISVGTTHHVITQRESIPVQKYRPCERKLYTVLRGHIQGHCHCTKQSMTKRLTKSSYSSIGSGETGNGPHPQAYHFCSNTAQSVHDGYQARTWILRHKYSNWRRSIRHHLSFSFMYWFH